LGYWNIRGIGQPIRLVMAYAEAELQEKRYNYGPPPEFDRSEWVNEKFSLGLEFPNLPYFIDGDTKITQSLAILRHVARIHKVDGTTEDEKIRIDIAEQQLNDMRMGLVGMCYSPDFEKLKPGYLKALPDQLAAVSKFLGERKWIAGDTFSYADIMLYEMVDQHNILSHGVTKDYANLDAHAKRFEALPTIEKYMKSDKYIKWPMNGDMASFGSRLQKQP